MQASELQLSLDKTLKALADMALTVPATASSCAVQPASASWPPPPPYICEWLSSPNITVVRVMVHGETRWLPNGPLQDAFVQAGAAEQLTAMLDPQAAAAAARKRTGPAALAVKGADACGVEAFHALDNAWVNRFTPHERPLLVGMLTSLWASVDYESKRPTLCEHSVGQPVHPNIGGVRLGPFRLRSRLVLLPDSDICWEAFHFVPWAGKERSRSESGLPQPAMAPCGGERGSASADEGSGVSPLAQPALPTAEQPQMPGGAGSSGAGEAGFHEALPHVRPVPSAQAQAAEVSPEVANQNQTTEGVVHSDDGLIDMVEIEQLLALC